MQGPEWRGHSLFCERRSPGKAPLWETGQSLLRGALSVERAGETPVGTVRWQIWHRRGGGLGQPLEPTAGKGSHRAHRLCQPGPVPPWLLQASHGLLPALLAAPVLWASGQQSPSSQGGCPVSRCDHRPCWARSGVFKVESATNNRKQKPFTFKLEISCSLSPTF